MALLRGLFRALALLVTVVHTLPAHVETLRLLRDTDSKASSLQSQEASDKTGLPECFPPAGSNNGVQHWRMLILPRRARVPV